jgi:hypothetical protein
VFPHDVQANTKVFDARAFGARATRMVDGDLQPAWTNVVLVADEPVKRPDTATRDQLMISCLVGVLGGGNATGADAGLIPGFGSQRLPV